jgi:tyrosinase
MATKAKTPAKKAAKKAVNYPVSSIYQGPRKIDVKQLPAEFSRADIEFIGIDHSGASYEARVFVNNPKANAETPATDANGYAGSYHIFGHGGCFGDVGHCDIHKVVDAFDPRPSHPLEPIRKVVIATDAIKQAVAQGGEITITVVPLIRSWTEKSEVKDVMKFDHINVVCYD